MCSEIELLAQAGTSNANRNAAGALSASPLKIVQIASDVSPRTGSTFTALPRLCSLLSSTGLDVTLLAMGKDARREVGNGFSTTICLSHEGLLGSLGHSPALIDEAYRLSRRSDVFHLHGLWRLSPAQALMIARERKIPAVLSPMGAFAPAALRASRLRKRAFWLAFQKWSLGGVSCYHATSHIEHDHIRAFGIRGPIAVIPLGIDLPELDAREAVSSAGTTVLFLGRICEIKNLISLVYAWRSIEADFPAARLRIIGPDHGGHAALVSRAAVELGAQRISIEPGQWGAAREFAFRQADLLILPSLSESFGLVVAEALAHALPVIATTGSPWQILEQERCGWQVDSSPGALAQGLRTALSRSKRDLAEMGARGRQFAERKLSWENSVAKFTRLYRWVAIDEDKPEFVSI